MVLPKEVAIMQRGAKKRDKESGCNPQTKSQEGRRLTQVKRCQLEPGEQNLRAVKTESRESAGSSREAPGRMNSLKGKHPGG